MIVTLAQTVNEDHCHFLMLGSIYLCKAWAIDTRLIFSMVKWSAVCCSSQCDSLACFSRLLYSKYSHFSYACLSCSHFQGRYSSFRLHAFSGTRRCAQKSLYPSGIFAFWRSSCTTQSNQFISVQRIFEHVQLRYATEP